MDAKKVEEMVEAGANLGTMMAAFYEAAIAGGVPRDAAERLVAGCLKSVLTPKGPTVPTFTSAVKGIGEN